MGADAPVKTWEIDVEMRVRTTLHFAGPKTAAAARALVGLIMAGEIGDITAFVKWGDGHGSGRPTPVQTILGNDPVIVAVRDLTKDGG